jgi:hypothetical protein
LFWSFVFSTVRTAATGLAYYSDHDGDGDDGDDYQDE